MAAEDERVPPVVRDPRIPKFPVIYAEPTFAQIKDNVNTNDLAQWAVLGSACFPLGYMVASGHSVPIHDGVLAISSQRPAMSMQLDRKLARPAMLFTGIMGCIGGALLSYQNSELRLQGYGRNDEEVARYLMPKKEENDASEQ